MKLRQFLPSFSTDFVTFCIFGGFWLFVFAVVAVLSWFIVGWFSGPMRDLRARLIVDEYESPEDPYRGMIQFRENGVIRIDHDDIVKGDAFGVIGSYKFIDDWAMQVEFRDRADKFRAIVWKVKATSSGLILTTENGTEINLNRVRNRTHFIIPDKHEYAYDASIVAAGEIEGVLKGVVDEKTAIELRPALAEKTFKLGVAYKRLTLLGEPVGEVQTDAIIQKQMDQKKAEVGFLSQAYRITNNLPDASKVLEVTIRKLNHVSWW